MASLEIKYKKLLAKIAKNIKKIRETKGVLQREMEDHGFDLRNYQRLESGEHSPSLFTLHKLAAAFKVDITDFFR